MNRLVVSSCILVKCVSLSFGWIHCDVSGILHTRKQLNNTYVFYLDNKNLKASVVDRTGERHDMPIADVPNDAISNLDPEKVNAIVNLLNESFFTTQCGKIRINPRGQGGWDERQHKGYSENQELHELTCYEGTYTWAHDIFEESFYSKDINVSTVAKIVADACASVDTDPATDPLRYDNLDINVEAQKWHFNVNQCPGGTENDSRLIIAINQLAIAVNKFKHGDRKNSLIEFGRGLHALQDIFAHTDAFVSLYTNPINGKNFLGHLGGTDDPYYIDESKFSYRTAVKADDPMFSQRYSDAKTASYIYLFCYRLLTEGFFEKFNYICSMKISNRIQASVNVDCHYEHYGIKQYFPKSRGTHAIHYLIEALQKKFRVACNFPKINRNPLFTMSKSFEGQFIQIPSKLEPQSLPDALLEAISGLHLFGSPEKDIEKYLRNAGRR